MKGVIIFSFLFGLLATSTVCFVDNETAISLTVEDGVIETFTAFCYFLGIILCIISIFRSSNNRLSFLWLFLCIIFLGEETSWFQRVFNYSVSAVEEINAQKEFNLHNLNIFQSKKIHEIGSIKDVLLSSQNLFRMGFFGYFILFPLFNKKNTWVNKVLLKIGYLTPHIFFTMSLLLVFIFSFSISLFSVAALKIPIAETREMLYSFFILIYVILIQLMKD